jgi:hypothetical protein
MEKNRKAASLPSWEEVSKAEDLCTLHHIDALHEFVAENELRTASRRQRRRAGLVRNALKAIILLTAAVVLTYFTKGILSLVKKVLHDLEVPSCNS